MAWLCGCAAREAGPPHAAPAIICSVVSGDPEEAWLARTPGEPWTEGGSQYVICEARVAADGGGSAGAVVAHAEALRQAYAFALGRLRGRGVLFGDTQITRMLDERVEAARRGEETTFPRIRAAGRVVESCEDPSAGRVQWRERLLVEYPIAYLRGDANNALWRAERSVNEAEVVIASARSFLAEGRWFDGLRELARASELLDSATTIPGRELALEEAELLCARAAEALSIEPVADVVVLGRGQRREVAVEFACSYEWEGTRVAAVGVPIEFRLQGLDAVCARDPESDASGLAVCRIVSAHGPPGEGSVEALVDLAPVAAAVGETRARGVRASTRAQKVFVVEGAHAVSICLDVAGLNQADEVQLRAGFERRAESDGYRIEDCGTNVGVVLSAQVVKNSGESSEGWSSTVVVDVSAFDQRVARGIGATTISSEERAEDGLREAEILALKEAGRLMAAYFANRMLLSRK